MAALKIIGLVSGEPTPFDRQYVVEYDPSRDGVDPAGDGMLCHLTTTPDRGAALELPKMAAFELWRKVDDRTPLRPDGKPNRPLTAFTVEIVG